MVVLRCILILLLAGVLVGCGREVVQPPSPPPPAPTPTPVPYEATQGPATLGQPTSNFVGKYGQPVGAGKTLYWHLGDYWLYVSLGTAREVRVQPDEGVRWDDLKMQRMCFLYMPPDVKYVGRDGEAYQYASVVGKIDVTPSMAGCVVEIVT